MPEIQDTSAQDRAITQRGLKRSTVFVLGFVGLAVVAIFPFAPKFQRWFAAEASFEKSRLRFGEVERGTLVRELSVEGKIVASSYPTLYSPAQGTISLFVKAGERVDNEQRLAVIASPEIENQVRQEASNLAALEAELSSEEVATRTSKIRNAQDVELKELRMGTTAREQKRTERSFADGLVDERELERTRDEAAIAKLEFEHAERIGVLEEESSEHELRNTRSQVERQRLVHEEAERRRAELTILSPVAGVIGSLSVEPRDIVIRNQEMMTVIDLSAFEIEISIPETFADDVHLGTSADITLEGRQYVGTVASVAPEVKNSLVEGRVVFDGDQPATLKQNQRVSTRIILSSKENVLKVRRGPFLESGGGRLSYVVEGELAVARIIETGLRSLTEVEIIAGLEVGDTIIISDTSRFEGADTVLLRE